MFQHGGRRRRVFWHVFIPSRYRYSPDEFELDDEYEPDLKKPKTDTVDFADELLFEHDDEDSGSECEISFSAESDHDTVAVGVSKSIHDSFAQQIGQIRKIQMSLLDPTLVVASSVCEVRQDQTDRKYPHDGGLYDLRMGPFSREFECLTCHQDIHQCPGHFGHIVLPLPVFHPLFKKRIVDMLRCVCFRCRRLLVDEWDPSVAHVFREQHGPSRFDQILKMSRRVKTCLIRPDATGTKFVGCGMEQPTFYLTPSMRIRINFADGTSTESVVDEVRSIYDVLRHVTNEDVVRMGMDPRFARPEWLLITVLPVPPTCVRPPIHRKGTVDDDDLTHKLHEIVAACRSLRFRDVMIQVLRFETTWMGRNVIRILIRCGDFCSTRSHATSTMRMRALGR